MATESRERFVRALRSLSRPSFSAFVAALWAARGHETSVDESGGVAIDREGRTLRVVAGVRGWHVLLVLLVRPDAVDAVVTRGRLAGAAVELVAGGRPGVAHLDAADLYERFRYGVGDAERVRLWTAHLRAGAENPGATVRFDDALRRTVSPVPASVAAAVLLVLVAGAAVGPLVESSSDDVASPELDDGARSPSTSETPTPTSTPESDVPSVCPPPPTDAHPAALHPGVIGTASVSGLEGWTILLEQNLTDFDPNDESSQTVPEIRHIVVYQTPGDRQYRLVLDRWASAERMVDRSRGSERAPLVWGAYSVAVEPYAVDESDLVASDVRKLLANVQTPGGVRLGYACVDALAEGS